MTRLRHYRLSTKQTLREIAEKIGITPATVHDAEVRGIFFYGICRISAGKIINPDFYREIFASAYLSVKIFCIKPIKKEFRATETPQAVLIKNLSNVFLSEQLEKC